MSDDKNLFADEYSDIHGEAHKRAASPAGVPSLIRFRGWWIDDSSAEATRPYGIPSLEYLIDSTNLDRETLIDAYRSAIERYNQRSSNFSNYYEVPSEQRLELFPNNNSKKYYTKSAKVDSIRFNIDWYGVLVKVQIELHTDWIGVQQVIDLSRKPESFRNRVKTVHIDPVEKDVRWETVSSYMREL